MIFKGLSVAKNCLRPESAPLRNICHKNDKKPKENIEIDSKFSY